MSNAICWHADRMGDAQAFIARAGEALQWGDLAGAVVMDVGCGTGESSLALVANFPDLERVIAFDNNKNKLKIAEERNSHPKIFYEQADLENKFTLAAWTGEIEKLVSVYCLNCLEDKRMGYQNLLQILKPGGEAAIVQSINSPYFDFLGELSITPNWIEIMKTLVKGIEVEKNSVQDYRKMIEEIGFEVVSCFQQTETFTFNYRKECKDIVIRTLKLATSISEDFKEDLCEEAFRIYVKHNPVNTDGHYTMTHYSMVALLRKPIRAAAKEDD